MRHASAVRLWIACGLCAGAALLCGCVQKGIILRADASIELNRVPWLTGHGPQYECDECGEESCSRCGRCGRAGCRGDCKGAGGHGAGEEEVPPPYPRTRLHPVPTRPVFEPSPTGPVFAPDSGAPATEQAPPQRQRQMAPAPIEMAPEPAGPAMDRPEPAADAPRETLEMDEQFDVEQLDPPGDLGPPPQASRRASLRRLVRPTQWAFLGARDNDERPSSRRKSVWKAAKAGAR